MRSDGYDAKVTTLLFREGFFKDRRSYLGHTVEDMEPHLHLEGEDRSNLRARLFLKTNYCQLKLKGCTKLATEMDHIGETADATRFDELAWVRRACHSCHHNHRHGRTVRSAKVSAEVRSGEGVDAGAKQADALAAIDRGYEEEIAAILEREDRQ